MEYNDFKRMFCEVSIVRVRDGYVNNMVRLPPLTTGSLAGVEMVVPSTANMCVEVHQPSKRCFPKEQFTFQYGGLVLEIVRLSPGPATLITTSEHARDAKLFADEVLEGGRYLVLVRGSVDRKRPCVLSTYAPMDIRLSVLGCTQSALEDMVGPAYCAAARSGGSKLEFGGPFGGVEAFEFSTGAVSVLTYTNNSTK